MCRVEKWLDHLDRPTLVRHRAWTVPRPHLDQTALLPGPPAIYEREAPFNCGGEGARGGRLPGPRELVTTIIPRRPSRRRPAIGRCSARIARRPSGGGWIRSRPARDACRTDLPRGAC